MAYPTTIETLPVANDTYTPSDPDHYVQHNDVNRIVNALQARLGIANAPLRLPQEQYEAANRATAAISAVGRLARTITSPTAATQVQDVRGNWLRISASTSGGIAELVPSAFSHTRLDWLPVLEFALQTDGILNKRIFAGLFSAAAPAADSLATVSALAFRFSTNASDTKWMAVASNGSAATVVDTGITVAVSTRYRFKIDASVPSSIKFSINDVLVATITATLPATSTPLGELEHMTALTAAQRNLDWGFSRLMDLP